MTAPWQVPVPVDLWGVVEYKWLRIRDLDDLPPLVPADVGARIAAAHATAWSRLATADEVPPRVPDPFAVRDDHQSSTSVPPASSASWLPWNLVEGGAVRVTSDADPHGPDTHDARTLWWVDGVMYAPAEHRRVAALRRSCTVERVESVPADYCEVVTQFISPDARTVMRHGVLIDEESHA